LPHDPTSQLLSFEDSNERAKTLQLKNDMEFDAEQIGRDEYDTNTFPISQPRIHWSDLNEDYKSNSKNYMKYL